MKLQGFKLGGKLVRSCEHHHHRPPHRSAYHRLLHHSPSSKQDLDNLELMGTMKILNLSQSLSRFTRAFLHIIDQARMSQGNKQGSNKWPPKGYLVVYVQEEEDEDYQKFLVPVVYVNHPLFVELLKEAEEKFEFHHRGGSGGITIPCPISVFENVRASIAANYAHRCRKSTMCCKGFDATTSAVSCN